MRFVPRRLRAVSWLAILAIVASVLAPVATRAMAAWGTSASPWDDICTSLGIRKAAPQSVAVEPGLPSDSDGARVPVECPYCLPSAQPAAPPSQPAGIRPESEPGISRFLFFFISAPHPTPIPESARPLAPPQFA